MGMKIERRCGWCDCHMGFKPASWPANRPAPITHGICPECLAGMFGVKLGEFTPLGELIAFEEIGDEPFAVMLNGDRHEVMDVVRAVRDAQQSTCLVGA